MASTAIEKLATQLDRMKLREKALRVKEHVQTQNIYAMGGAVVGAAAAGVIDAKYNADGTSKKTTGALVIGGAALALGGVTDYIPGGMIIGMTGVGVLCYVVGKGAHDWEKNRLASAA